MSRYAVCYECGIELITDEEQEIGLCDKCYEKQCQQKLDELEHPDSGK